MDQKLKKTTRSLLFHQKPLALQHKLYENLYFPVKFEKNQKTLAFLKTSEKTLSLRDKTSEP